MKKAVIYARFSSHGQTEQSIEGQLRVCNEYAQQNNIVIVDTWVDRLSSRANIGVEVDSLIHSELALEARCQCSHRKNCDK